MPIITTTKQMRPRAESDFYPTPDALVQAALDLLPMLYPEFYVCRILDPGAGDGVWGRLAAQRFQRFHWATRIVGVELRDTPKPEGYNAWHVDNFINWQTDETFDFAIGNPPYAELVINPRTGKKSHRPLAERFVRKSIGLLRPSGICLFLLRLAFLESKERVDLFKTMPPRYVYVCVNRPSFGAVYKGGTDATAYCLLYFEKGWYGEPTLRWLNWK